MEMDDDEFTGKVSIFNWAQTRKQKILRDTEFEDKIHDIYNPEFSSDEEQQETSKRHKSSKLKLITAQKDYLT